MDTGRKKMILGLLLFLFLCGGCGESPEMITIKEVDQNASEAEPPDDEAKSDSDLAGEDPEDTDGGLDEGAEETEGQGEEENPGQSDGGDEETVEERLYCIETALSCNYPAENGLCRDGSPGHPLQIPFFTDPNGLTIHGDPLPPCDQGGGGEIPANGLDDDGDGKIDLADTDLTTPSGGPTVCHEFASGAYTRCGSAQTNDLCDTDITEPAVGFIADSIFDGTQCRPFEEETTREQCGDSLDNDGNGQTDAADNGCYMNGQIELHPWREAQGGFQTPVDFGRFEDSCSDGRDNDGDGWYDCWDRDCFYGSMCPPIDQASCTDTNGNGRRRDDWDDLAAAPEDQKQSTAVCARLYDVDATTNPDTDGRQFLRWMADKGYAPRVITLHAEQMENPGKRNNLPLPGFQLYLNMRLRPIGKLAVLFKQRGPLPVIFHEVSSTDSWMRNQTVTEEEATTILKRHLEETYYREIEITYQPHSISYETTFGIVPCREGSCLDRVRVKAWVLANEHPEAIHFFHLAGESAQPQRPFFSHLYAGFYSYGFQPYHTAQTSWVYAHEMGHLLALPHPITTERQSFAPANLRNLLGTTSVMSWGYVHTSVKTLGPIESYALEPVGGFDPDMGRNYSLQLLGTLQE